jgi:hypothetical protein
VYTVCAATGRGSPATIVVAVSRLGCSRVAATINPPAAISVIPHQLNRRANRLASSAITAPAKVTQPHEGKLEAAYDVWRTRRDAATAAMPR